ncbi:WD repeat-containing protein jip5 [Tulasnella sp. 417]|nr:WD repeat-containing protein jip5 [Tulasnella sp. 417]
MPDIPLKHQCFDLTFSPTADQVYVGLLNGSVKGFSYDSEGNASQTFSLRPAKQSCRGVSINGGGDRLYVVSKDRGLRSIDPARGAIAEEKLGAHDSAINRVLACTPSIVATGDDEGVIKLWDPRKQKEIKSFTHHFDYISDLLFTEEKNQIVASSGDCTLSVIDIRSSRTEPFAQSDDQDDEFLSLCSIKDNTKLIVGTQLGILSIFNRSSASAYLGPVDRMPGHPSSVDAVVALTDDVVATGSSDGLIRLVQIMPNKLLGAVADHGDFPVERLGLSRDGKWLASASHDELLKLTDVADALEESEGEDEDAEMEDVASEIGEDEDEVPQGALAAALLTGRGTKRPAESTASSEVGDEAWKDSDMEMAVVPSKSRPMLRSPSPTPTPKREKKERQRHKKPRGNQPRGVDERAAFFADL